MFAKDVMSAPVITVMVGSLLRDVAGVLEEHHISGVPVVDSNGDMIGIVTEFDLIKKGQEMRVVSLVSSFGWFAPSTPVSNIAQFVEGLATIGNIPVEDVMTRHVVTVNEDTSLEEIAHIMVRRGVNRIPVVRGSEVVGIVTRRDLIAAIVKLTER
jgi:CBS domain-containing protein